MKDHKTFSQRTYKPTLYYNRQYLRY